VDAMLETEAQNIYKKIQKGEISSLVQLDILLDEIASNFVEGMKRSGVSPDQNVPKVQGGKNLEQ
jgi:hypothetical protein